MENPILTEDLNKIGKEFSSIKEIDNSDILVTGATGLIGSQIVKAILHCNEHQGTNISVIALVRSRDKALTVFSDYIHSNHLKITQGDVLDDVVIEKKIDFIIHGASTTDSKAFVETPVETIDVAINGTKNMLSLAKKKKIKAFVYLSSLEIYGIPNNPDKTIKENDYGYIDHNNVRSSYSESKRMAECLCIAYAKQYNVPIKIARLSQTFGAGVNYQDGRVFAQFARSIIEKKDIVLHTTGDTLRNYCYTSDAVTAILTILIKGKSLQAYNIANRRSAISIKDMAKMLVNNYKESDIRVVYNLENVEEHGYNPTVKIRLDTSKIEKLGWEAKIELNEMFDRLIKSMSFSEKNI